MGIGLFVAGVGLEEQYRGSKKQQENYDEQARLSQQSTAASARAEAARRQQMELDAKRQQTQLARQYAIARSSAIARAAASGTSAGENFQSSALGGAESQLSSQLGYNSGNISENLQGGRTIFDANEDIFNIQSQQANLQSQIYSVGSNIDMGKTLFGIGSSIVSHANTTGKLYDNVAGGGGGSGIS